MTGTEESKTHGIQMGITPNGVNYGIIDHTVRFMSKSRVCINCGKQLRTKQRALAIITNCPQTLPRDDIPGNLFIHAKCLGDIDEATIGKKIDDVVKEYQIVKDFIKIYGSKWGIKIFMYGD